MTDPSPAAAPSAPPHPVDSAAPGFARAMLPLLPVMLVLVVAMILYVRHEAAETRTAAEQSVVSVANLKAGQIASWMRERRGDAAMMGASLPLRELLAAPADPAVRAEAARHLAQLCDTYGYQAAAVFAADGVLRLAAPAGAIDVLRCASNHVQHALRRGAEEVTDFHTAEPGGQIHLGLLALIRVGAATSGPPAGVALLVVDPRRFLFPYLHRWPVASSSAECQLVRRDGEDVEIVSDQDGPGGTPSIRRVAAAPASGLSFRAAALGERGLMRGEDDRGASSIAAASAVPDTPWVLLAKVATEEVEAPIGRTTWMVVLVTGVGLLALALGVIAWRRQRWLATAQLELTIVAEAQSALQRSEARARAMLDAMPDMMFRMTDQGVFLDYKADAKDLYSQGPGDPVGRRARDLMPAAFCELLEENIRAALASGAVRTFEYELDLPGGRGRRQYEARMSANGPGEVTAVVRNITERRRVEDRLRASEERFRAIFEGCADGILLADPATQRFKGCNEALCRMTGYSAEQIATMGVRDFHPSAELSAVMEQFGRHLRGEATLSRNLPVLRRDGTVFYADVSTALIPAEGITYLAGFFRDVTGRKEAEEKLQASEERFRSIFQSSVDGILLADVETRRFRMCNAAVCQMLGYTADELTALHVDDIHPAEDLPWIADYFRRQVSGEFTLTRDVPVVRKDGSRFYADINTSVIAMGGHRLAAGFFRDVSARKQAEQFHRIQLELARELSSCHDLVAGLRHCLSAAIRATGLDAGGFYLRDERTGAFDLVVHQGLSDELVRDIAHYESDSDQARLTVAGEPYYVGPGGIARLSRVAAHGDGLRFIAILPLRHEGVVIGALDLGSHTHEDLPATLRQYAEIIADEACGALVRLRAERAMRDGERHRGAILDNIPDAAWLKDAGGRFLAVNRAWQDITRIDAARAIGHTAQELFPPAVAAAFDRQDAVVRSSTRPERFTENGPDERGEAMTFETYIAPLVAADGSSSGTIGIARDITATRRAEMLMRRSESMLVQAQRIGRVGAWEWDIAQQTMYWTGETYRIHDIDPTGAGADPQTLIDLSARCYAEEDRHRVLEAFRKCAAQGVPYELECRFTSQKGRALWIRTAGTAVREGGRIVRVIGDIQDITMAKQVETALQESREKLRMALEGARMGVWEFDFASGALHWSPDMYKNLGVPPMEPTRERLWAMLHPEDAAIPQREMDRALREHDFYQCEYRVNLGSRHIWVEDRGRIAWGADGRPLKVIGTAQDITARKLAETERLRLAAAVDQAAEIIIITDLQGAIQYVNPAFEKTTGYTRQEAIGQNPRMLKSGRHEAAFYRQLWSVVAEGGIWRGQIENRRKDGEGFVVDAVISSIRGADGGITHFVAAMRDITREQQLRQQVQQAQKMEAVGQLAGGVAHDFNNILFAMLMHIQMLNDSPHVDPQLRGELKELNAHVNRAAALTRQLLLFSRRSVMQTAALQLNDVIRELLKMLRRILGEDIQLDLQLAEDLPLIECDAGMIEQIVVNLSVNARDAMPGGGRLTFATSLVSVTAAEARVHSKRRVGPFVCLAITDTGCGMDEKTQRRIFEPFFTTKEIGKGTGLGLATVYGIAEQHKGWIEVLSAPGEGSTFTVFLPAHIAPAAAEPRSGVEVPVKGGRETLLIVEDEAAVRALLVAYLRKMGYRIIEASNGPEALDLWDRHAAAIDLLYTDMVMPGGVSGLDLAELFRASKPSLKVLLTSGYSSHLTDGANLAKSGITFVAKPSPPREIAAVVRTCLDAKG